MILGKRDTALKVTEAVEKMLGVRRNQMSSAWDLFKFDSLVDLVSRDSEEPLEVASQARDALCRGIAVGRRGFETLISLVLVLYDPLPDVLSRRDDCLQIVCGRRLAKKDVADLVFLHVHVFLAKFFVVEE